MAEKKFIQFGLTKSKMEKLLRCPFAYDCHYNKKIRPLKSGSALMFGIAIDEGLNALLKNYEVDPMIYYKRSTEKHSVESVDWSRYDYDRHIIKSEDRKVMLKALKEFGYKGNDIDELWITLFKLKKKSKNQEKALDYIGRYSLQIKAKVMFDSYIEQVLPRIKKVHAIQKQTENGILDAILDYEDEDGVDTYITDNKTASMAYDEKEAETSVQMIGYAIDEKIDKMLYIVIPKKIVVTKKRMYVKIQFVKANVTEQMKKRATDIKAGVQKIIDTEAYICNFTQCNNQFGKSCQYKDLYWKGSMDGLEDQSKKK